MTSKLSFGTVESVGEGRAESTAMFVREEVRLGVRGGEKASIGSGERRSDTETVELRGEVHGRVGVIGSECRLTFCLWAGAVPSCC